MEEFNIKNCRKIEACRSCQSIDLKPILSLGKIYVSDFIKTSSRRGKFPLELVLCADCNLLQLRHTTNPELLYREYWYKSGINESIMEDLNDIVEKAEKMVKPQSGDIVLDIGCNDGSMLRLYKTKGLKLVGFEPALNLIKDAEKGTTKIIPEFFNYKDFNKYFKDEKAKVISCVAMFYDLDFPNIFVEEIKKVLDTDGIWIIEQRYLPSMLEQNDIGNICVKPDTIILGDNKPIQEIKIGNKIIGSTGTLDTVKEIMKRHYEGNLIKIKPTYLEEINCTPEHPILIAKKEYFRFPCNQLLHKPKDLQLEWIPAKLVKRGDFVVVPKLIPDQQKKLFLDLTPFNKINERGYRWGLLKLPLNEETAWFLGLYVAEGYTGGKKKNPYFGFSLNITEQQIKERISKIAKDLGYKTEVVDRRKYSQNAIDVRIVCAALARALPLWCGPKARTKRIPDFIMFGTDVIKKAFLRGLFQGDGYIKRNKVHFHTSSKTLALQTQLLVASFGGMLGISYVKPYPRIIRGKEIISHDSWQLRGSSKILSEIFDYQYNGPDTKHIILTDDHILVPVKKVGNEFYKGEVFNIGTNTKSYLVNNAIIHNCHEHVEYYSLLSLKNLLERHNLEIFDIELNKVNGGSFRTYIKHKGSALEPRMHGRVEHIENAEKSLRLDTETPYKEFALRSEAIKKQLYNFIKSEHDAGKIIYVYGASTKGNTMLQYYGINHNLIEAAAERDLRKVSMKTVGTEIPIISEENSRKRADYFLILPWHFLDVFLEREKEFLGRGGKFIVPLPEFKIIGNEKL